MYTLEKKTIPLYVLYTLMPQIISLPTLTLVYKCYEESNPGEKTLQEVDVDNTLEDVKT